MVRDSKIAVTVSPYACIYAASMLLLIPFQWCAAWLFTAACHEFFHCLVLWLFRKPIERISVDIRGAQIQTTDLSPVETVLCALAGPLGGVLMILLCRTLPKIVICAFFQTVFNLLPIYPLDGGRALEGVMRMFLPERWIRPAADLIEGILLAALVTVGFLSVFVWKLGIIPLLVAVLLVIQRKSRKIPCKWGALKVQ